MYGTRALKEAQADSERAWRRFCHAVQNGGVRAVEAAELDLRAAWRRFDRVNAAASLDERWAA
ncbi:hypothetical protein [Tsukamurella paurometabola]|uniref:Uncharacterized protein n=1 Tax=Tsukamurella paurometabola TaxID=2061 RepID=A0A3P8KBU6_TSUPA|nr:hypothetical protein [Tsukamurella paurometabola]UEA84433.1 hypothetical protein LK411_06315 [Tsukamurella paurometabola]VDR36998.1 Uncharacterised protein [Tsukamurella paurometabola]